MVFRQISKLAPAWEWAKGEGGRGGGGGKRKPPASFPQLAQVARENPARPTRGRSASIRKLAGGVGRMKMKMRMRMMYKEEEKNDFGRY